ncbi:MAG: hypothetical protein U0930_25435 [Pirellulales bacterium]
MSIVAVACPKQLSFPWMQSEVAVKSNRKSTNRSRTAQSAQARAELVSPVAQQPLAQRPVAVVAIPSSQPNAVAPAAIKLSKVEATVTVPAVAIDRNQRVGEVRIGKVMMQLLKRYGITDDEISSVLATIAQEKCENLAS